MKEQELWDAMDERYFARCVWQEEDLDDIEGIEKLPNEMRAEFMAFASRGVESVMTSVGWDALSDSLTEFLSEHGIEVDDDDDEYFDTEENV